MRPSPPVKLEIPGSAEEQLSYWTNFSRDPYPDSFVYVIQAQGDAPIKVGVAKNVRKRIATLQTGNPRRLELLAVLVGDAELEYQLHRKLKSCRVLGEWFEGPELPVFVAFARDLAERMIAAYQTTKHVPDWRDFGDWEGRKRVNSPSPVSVSFVAPAPLSPEQVTDKLFQREKERGYAISKPKEHQP